MRKMTKFLRDFINKQYELVGSDKTFQYAVDNEKWIEEYEITQENQIRLWAWAIKVFRKRFKTSQPYTVDSVNDIMAKFGFHVVKQESETLEETKAMAKKILENL